MTPITNTEAVIALVGRWMPTDVAFIRELRYLGSASDEGGQGTTEVHLRLLLQPRPPQSIGWPDPDRKYWEVEMRFRGVRNFALRQEVEGDIQVEGFDIEDHSTSQLEKLRLRVTDFEDGRLTFWARGGEVLGCRESQDGPTTSHFGRVYPGEFPE